MWTTPNNSPQSRKSFDIDRMDTKQKGRHVEKFFITDCTSDEEYINLRIFLSVQIPEN